MLAFLSHLVDSLCQLAKTFSPLIAIAFTANSFNSHSKVAQRKNVFTVFPFRFSFFSLAFFL